ncbi:MAG: thioesterase family protein [Eubacteriales bacterium]|jgi:predicted thioesterase
MLETGIKGTAEEMVTEEKTAWKIGSGELLVYATPCMMALIEKAAWTSVADELEDGQGTVGTLLNVQHEAPTPVGMKVTAETVLKEIDGRRLVFDVTVKDEKGVIGEGTHERFIIKNKKFSAKAEKRKEG